MNLPSCNQLASYSEWLRNTTDDEEEVECFFCSGTGWYANRCKCGTMPSIEEEECVLCGAPTHIKHCPVCMGKGTIVQ